MIFRRGELFQTVDSQLLWNKISAFNQLNPVKASSIPKKRIWTWGQVAGRAVADFNRSESADFPEQS